MKTSKYNEYRKAAKDLERLLEAIRSEHVVCRTLEDIQGLPKGKRLFIDRRKGKTEISLID